MIVSVTELHLKNFWSFLRFIPHAMKSKMQADKAPGVLSSQVSAQGLLCQRTLTTWDSRESMLNCVRSGSHPWAMKLFSKIANQSFSYRYEAAQAPSWPEALEQLKRHGRALGKP